LVESGSAVARFAAKTGIKQVTSSMAKPSRGNFMDGLLPTEKVKAIICQAGFKVGLAFPRTP
jgi:hypothetical protein